MSDVVVCDGLVKRYDAVRALDGIDLSMAAGRVVGLVGRNGSGKSTLLHCVSGLVLPTEGTAKTFGTPAGELGDADLGRLGIVHQQHRFLGWMTVQEHVHYVSTFHAGWDATLAGRMMKELELDPGARIRTLSPGNVQKLALVLALGHRPELLLLDEPVSALDPLAREALLVLLLELARDRGTTVVISSHVLRDVERIVDWIVCLEGGRVVVDAGLDDLRERYAEWRVLSRNGPLPQRFDEPFVLAHEGDGRQASLCVLDAGDRRAAFEEAHHVRVEVHPLNLERMFPLWTRAGVVR
jgi:ABC-2 type transport system ATP-binding protein